MKIIKMYVDDKWDEKLCDYIYSKKKWRKRVGAIFSTTVPDELMKDAIERAITRIENGEAHASAGWKCQQKVMDILLEERSRYHGE